MNSVWSIVKRPVFLNLVRGYRGRQSRNQVSNPGIRGRLQLFDKESSNLDTIEMNEETLDDMESDFMNAREIMTQHQREIFKMRRTIDLIETERKHFGRIKYPNMLTWTEKEQIRQLYNSDPDVWNFEKLSKSFPATPTILKKIIKSQWKFRNAADIENHDRAVAANWKKLKEGSLDIDDTLKMHLLSFSNRTGLAESSWEVAEKEEKPIISAPIKEGEFSKIITSYVEQVEKKDTLSNKQKPLHLNSTKKRFDFVSNFPSGNKHITLDELRKEVAKHSESRGFFVSESEKHFIDGNPESISKFNSVPEDNIECSIKKSIEIKPSAALIQNLTPDTESNVVPPDVITPKIKIPYKLRRRGSIFRKVDCYYDSYGNFLYRVPGMTSS